MPKKVPNTQKLINNVILKIVNIVFSRGQLPGPRAVASMYSWGGGGMCRPKISE